MPETGPHGSAFDSGLAPVERIEGPAPAEDSSVPPDPIESQRPGSGQRTAETAVRLGRTVDLPSPRERGGSSLEETIASRRSIRSFTSASVTLHELSQLLWAAQGITARPDARTSPSAGATYPLELYAATRNGCHHYQPDGHRLHRLTDRDLRSSLAEAAYGQTAIRDAAVVIIITAVLARTSTTYGERASRFVAIEAGHVAQNVLLQAVALGLGGVPIGAFDDDHLRRALGADPHLEPLYLVAAGHPGRHA